MKIITVSGKSTGKFRPINSPRRNLTYFPFNISLNKSAFCKQSYWFWYLHECTTSLQRLEMPVRPMYFPFSLEARHQKTLRIKT